MRAKIVSALRAVARARAQLRQAALDFITDAPLSGALEHARAIRAALTVMAWAQCAAVLLLAVIAAGVWIR